MINAQSSIFNVQGKERRGFIKKEKLTVGEDRLGFSKVLDLQKLTGRLLRTLDVVGDGPFQSTF